MIASIKISRTTPVDLSRIINQNYCAWRGSSEGDGLSGDVAQDERSLVLTEIDWTQVQFRVPLYCGEATVIGEEMLRRLKALPIIRLDAQAGMTLFENYHRNHSDSILEWLRHEKGICSLLLPGTEIRGLGRSRYILCLSWGGDTWNCGYYWLERTVDVMNAVAFLAGSSLE